MSIPNSLTIPSLFPSPPYPWLNVSSFSKSVSLFLFCNQVHLFHFLLDSIYKECHTLLLFFLLTYFTQMSICRSIQVATKGIISFLSLSYVKRPISILLTAVLIQISVTSLFLHLQSPKRIKTSLLSHI